MARAVQIECEQSVIQMKMAVGFVENEVLQIRIIVKIGQFLEDGKIADAGTGQFQITVADNVIAGGIALPGDLAGDFAMDERPQILGENLLDRHLGDIDSGID